MEDAEDVVQDVFVKIYAQKRFHKFEKQEVYFYKMIANVCMDFMRRKKTKFRVYQDFELENQTISENEAIQNLKLEEGFICLT